MRRGMKAVERGARIMYNVIRACRTTDRRPQANPRGRAARGASDARPQGACQARGSRFIGGSSQVHGRMGLQFCLPRAASAPTSHQSGARDVRSGLRSLRVQASPRPTASTMRQRTSLCSAGENMLSASRPLLLKLNVRRLPSVASGRQDNRNSEFFNRAGSTLAGPCFGPENGVHPSLR
jgi:hypothetical protein